MSDINPPRSDKQKAAAILRQMGHGSMTIERYFAELQPNEIEQIAALDGDPESGRKFTGVFGQVMDAVRQRRRIPDPRPEPDPNPED